MLISQGLSSYFTLTKTSCSGGAFVCEQPLRWETFQQQKTCWASPSVGISIYGFASPPRWLWGSKRSSTSDVFFSRLAFLVFVAGDSLFPLHLLLLLFKEIPSLHGCSDGPSRSTAVHNPGKISSLGLCERYLTVILNRAIQSWLLFVPSSLFWEGSSLFLFCERQPCAGDLKI